MSELLQIDLNTSYETRIERLKSAHIALWDVLKSCKREGSLDSNIQSDSLTVNDLMGFFEKYQFISKVCFNGTKAENCFNHFVAKTIGGNPKQYIKLPSTSPANASISYEEKFKIWKNALFPLGDYKC